MSRSPIRIPAPYRKVLRDLWIGRNRVAMMVIAIALSLTTVGAVVAGGAILAREMPRNYLATEPASATLETDGITPGQLTGVAARQDVAAAAARLTVTARVRIGERWRPMLLFVAAPDDPMAVARFDVEQGAWPPAAGSLLIERSGVEMLGASVGGPLSVEIGSGPAHTLTVSGVVHDASLAPSWQENTAYGFTTPATIQALGGSPTLDEVRVVLAGRPDDAAVIDAQAQQIAASLEAQGVHVSEVRIPPPNQHPHQWQLTVVVGMLLAFGLAAVILASVLVAAIVSAMLAEQVRQIGVLKAVGAAPRQIAAMYTLLPATVGLLAGLAALLPTMILGAGLSSMVGSLLNLDLADQSIPLPVLVLEVVAGITLPVLASLVPIVRASRVTVRQAIDDHGVRPEGGRVATLERALTRLRGLGRPTLFALRNTVRRPTRALLTVAMLGLGGAIFLAGLNTVDAWNRTIDDGLATRHYDLELRLAVPVDRTAVEGLVAAVPGVASVEAWGAYPTAVATPGQVNVVRTYPDKGHGSFSLVGLPPSTDLIDFPVLDGRWLTASDATGTAGTALVLNQTAAATLPGVGVGDSLTLDAGGVVATWNVVGIVEELGSPATAYVSEPAFAAATGSAATARLVRIVVAPGETPAIVLDRVDTAVSGAGIPVALSLTTAELRGAIDQHVMVLLAVLILTAILIAIVGSLGLATAMSINVLERTREIGVLHTLGALPGTVQRMVATEGLAVGLASVPVAMLLSLPLSAVVGSVIGSLSFRVPLELTVSPVALLVWVAVVAAGSLLAGWVPARNASRLPPREALAYA
jgi:putative ABC transport system permease protein